MKNISCDDKSRKLHIGGVRKKSDWEILNVVDGIDVDHVADAKNLTIFSDDTFSEIYASHVLEHFSYVEDLNVVLREWRRVLTYGGRLRISVPDLDILCKFILDKSISFRERFLAMRMIYGGQNNKYDFHYVGFNFEILEFYLKKNGFQRIKKVDSFNLFPDSSDKILCEKKISLNIEAWKIKAV